MPYEELPHTADWSLRVWATDLSSLFVEAARGMNALTGLHLSHKPETRRIFVSAAPDPEGLLVAFLSELVFYAEQEKLGFNEFILKIDNQRLEVEMIGAPLIAINKTIKAVTYHNLQIRQTERGYEVVIVFDV